MSDRAGIPSWTRMPCDLCGVEYQATRTLPAVPPFVCSDCDSHARGRWDGVAEALGVALDVRAKNGSLPDAIRELERLLEKDRHE